MIRYGARREHKKMLFLICTNAPLFAICFLFSLWSFDPIPGPVAPLLLSPFVLHSACSLSAVVFSQTVRVMYVHLTFITSAQSPFFLSFARNKIASW